jgi:pyruvate formate lyase activating enzyme
MTVAEVVAEVLKDRIFYDESRGGVTFSGGEPLMQPRFLKGLLAESRRQGLHTVVDTAGYAPAADLLALAPLVDLFLYDLKSLDDERHREATGVSNEPILANLEALGEVHRAIWVRVPVVPGFNDEPGQLETIARHAASIAGVQKLCLLPYHALGEHKAARLRPAPPGDETRHEVFQRSDDEPLSRESLEEIAGVLRTFGLEVQIGG